MKIKEITLLLFLKVKGAVNKVLALRISVLLFI